MPSNNQTTTTVRFGGKAVLNIDYQDYELSESHLTAANKHWAFLWLSEPELSTSDIVSCFDQIACPIKLIMQLWTSRNCLLTTAISTLVNTAGRCAIAQLQQRTAQVITERKTRAS